MPANCVHNKVLHVHAASAPTALESGRTARFSELHSLPSYFATERLVQGGDQTRRFVRRLTRVRVARKRIRKSVNVMAGI
jgi:hypothetical protein